MFEVQINSLIKTYHIITKDRYQISKLINPGLNMNTDPKLHVEIIKTTYPKLHEYRPKCQPPAAFHSSRRNLLHSSLYIVAVTVLTAGDC